MRKRKKGNREIVRWNDDNPSLTLGFDARTKRKKEGKKRKIMRQIVRWKDHKPALTLGFSLMPAE